MRSKKRSAFRVLLRTMIVLATYRTWLLERRRYTRRPTHARRVVVTAASSNHLGSVFNLIRSYHSFGDGVAPLFVYGLNLSQAEFNILRETDGISPRKLDFSKLPEHMDIDIARGEYAWKPVIIKEMSMEFDSVLWLDAGCMLRRNVLRNVFHRIETRGFISTETSGDVKTWTHPMTIKYLKNIGIETRIHERMCNGAIIGFDAKVFDTLLLKWYQCAFERDCIAPIGSSRANHRQDQSVLTILANHFGYRCRKSMPFMRSPESNIMLHQDMFSSVIRLCHEDKRVCGGYFELDNGLSIPAKGMNLCEISRSSLGKVPVYHFELYRNPDILAGGRQNPIVVFEIMREMMSAADLSIIMPVYNAAPAIKISIPKLFLTSTASWELTVILDACYDSSFDVARKLISEHFHSSSCTRARIIYQPTAIWEVSSDNLGMRTTQPKYAYVLVQADNLIDEIGWDKKMLTTMLNDTSIFGISGRCGHSHDNSNKIGRCSEDVAKRLSKHQLETGFRFTETINRGPLMYRASTMQKLQFMDEVRFLLDGDDHDVNIRAAAIGYRVGYLPIGSYAPLHLSARRNPMYRVYTPDRIKVDEEKFKNFRIKRSEAT